MEKNRTYGKSVNAGGARIYDAAGENGYGLNSEAPFSNGTPTYQPQPQYAPPINLDGLNMTPERKHRGGDHIHSRPAESAMGGNGRDGIERMGDESGSERIGRAF